MENREIKFRGKRVDNGEWVYGYYQMQNKSGALPAHYIHNEHRFTIDGNSVGQFTGLLDKKGKEIYEGDIVSAWSEGYNHKGEVRWRHEGQPAIIIYPAFANQGFWKLHGHMNTKKQFTDDGVVIIGNIFENPELLK